jgi:hypothetical protein
MSRTRVVLLLATGTLLGVVGMAVASWGWSKLNAPGGLTGNIVAWVFVLAVLIGLALITSGIGLAVWTIRRWRG